MSSILDEFEEILKLKNIPEREIRVHNFFSKLSRLRINKEFKILRNIPHKYGILVTPAFIKIAYTSRIRRVIDLFFQNPFSSLFITEKKDNTIIEVTVIRNNRIPRNNIIGTLLPVFFGKNIIKTYIFPIPVSHRSTEFARVEVMIGREISLIINKRKLQLVFIRGLSDIDDIIRRLTNA